MLSREDRRYLRTAQTLTQTSDDPSTKVGCLIAIADRQKVIYGINSLPQGIRRDLAVLPREERLSLIVHAEMDALCTAARFGDCLLGATLYIAAYSVADRVYWGSMPCVGCAKHVIAAGIQRIVCLSGKHIPERWLTDVTRARDLIEEAGLIWEEADDHTTY